MNVLEVVWLFGPCNANEIIRRINGAERHLYTRSRNHIDKAVAGLKRRGFALDSGPGVTITPIGDAWCRAMNQRRHREPYSLPVLPRLARRPQPQKQAARARR